jgi:hypothetical protein
MLKMLAAVALAAGTSAAGSAHAAADSGFLLACEGTDLEVRQSGQTTVVTSRPGTDPGIGSAQHRAAVVASTASTQTTTTPTYVGVRVPARMSVIVDGEKVRIRPSENNRPGLGRKASADGWYDLSDVQITEMQIRGRAGYGGLLTGRHRLAIDRQTGDATFGDFQGVCDKAATGPAERRF